MKDYDVWEKYQADKAADKKAKEEAKYEAGKRALDSKYDQQKKSEAIAKAAKLKMANDAVESHRRAGNLADSPARKRTGYNPPEDKAQYVKDNEKRIKDWEAKQAAKKADDKATKVTKKEVTVETPSGNIGSRNSFDAGEVSPFAKREAAVEKLIDYPSRTADVVAEKVEEAKAADEPRFSANNPMGMKKGGSVRAKAKSKSKCMSSGGSTSSKASSRGDGCAQRGKTRGRMV